MRTCRPPAREPMTVRSARAVRPPLPMTLPRSSGCTRTSRTLPRRSDLLATWTSSGYWTMPRTRCSRASSSTSGSAPRLVGRGLRVGGRRRFGGRRRVGGGLARGIRVRVRGFGRGLAPGGPGRLGPVLLGGTLLGGALLGRAVLGALGFLGGLALLGRGREALLLVRARLGGAESALGPRFPGELLPVPGDL